MAKKVFVSYKYADNDVKSLFSNGITYYNVTTVRDYVTAFQDKAVRMGIVINKGEKENEDLSYLSESTIYEKLKDRIQDSTVTVVFISPNMKVLYKEEKNQWVPREISFSLRDQTRNECTSHSNALVFVILPDRNGSYSYYRFMNHFRIVKANIDNGYGAVFEWEYFMNNIERCIDKAEHNKIDTPTYKIVKNV